MLGMIVAIPRSSSADTAQFVSSTDLIKTYKNALTEPLNKAIGEVKDRDIADFSQKLVSSRLISVKQHQAMPAISRWLIWCQI